MTSQIPCYESDIDSYVIRIRIFCLVKTRSPAVLGRLWRVLLSKKINQVGFWWYIQKMTNVCSETMFNLKVNCTARTQSSILFKPNPFSAHFNSSLSTSSWTFIEFSSASLDAVRIFLTRQRRSTQREGNFGNFNPIMRWQQATSDLKASW